MYKTECLFIIYKCVKYLYIMNNRRIKRFSGIIIIMPEIKKALNI